MNSKSISMNDFVRAWRVPALLFFVLVALTGTLAYHYERNDSEYLRAKAEKTAEAIALNLTTAIENRIAILRIIGKIPGGAIPASLKDIAPLVTSDYPGFFALNWVDKNGIIKEVHPYSSNMKALGQNLSQRDDVKDFLSAARSQKKAYMSHKLMTYQNVPAFVIYRPIFNERGEFIGWLNGVVDFDGWLVKFLESNKLDNVRVVLKWTDPTSQVVDRGNPEAKEFFLFTSQILNQSVGLQIAFAPDRFDVIKRRYYHLIIAVGVGFLALALLALVLLNITKIRLQKISETLFLKNRLISTLCHDLSSPLSIFEMTIDCDTSGAVTLDRQSQVAVTRSIVAMKEMLSSVKSLHAHNLGILKIKTIPLAVKDVLIEMDAVFKPQLNRKNLKLVVEAVPADWTILADPTTLVNNVLLNVMTNAIKFSPEGGTITVRSEKKSKEIHLIVEDEGTGMDSTQLKNFLKLGRVDSTAGTKGEQGTGLGLMQIFGFMKGYGGRVEAQTASSGNFQIRLVFKPSTPSSV